MNKNNLGLVLVTATLIFGGCKNANNVDIVEVDSSEVTQNLMVDSEEIKELVESDDNEEMDEVENELIDMELLVSTATSSNKPSSSNGSSSSSGSTTPSNPTPPVVEQPKPQKPVDMLDWNSIKSTLIATGQSLGMIYEPSMNRELDGYASPWQSSYMPVNNEDVIGYIGYQMEQAASWGRTYFNLEMVVQTDGNVLIYLIR